MNEILFIVSIIINFAGITLIYKFFSKAGLFAWIAFATVIANIECTKCIDLFGVSATLGNIIYGTIFLATDVLSEEYGKKEAHKGVMMGFFSMVTFTVMMQVNINFIPNNEDFSSSAMSTIFGFMPRLCIASMMTYLISNNIDVYLFSFLKKKFPKYLWLRNNVSTMTSQLIDSILFTFIAYTQVFEVSTVIKLTLTTYIIKVIVALADTPFLYLLTKNQRYKMLIKK